MLVERLRLARAAVHLEGAKHRCPDCKEPMRYVVVSRANPSMFGLYALCSDLCSRRQGRADALPIWQKLEVALPADDVLDKELEVAAQTEVAIRTEAKRR